MRAPRLDGLFGRPVGKSNFLIALGDHMEFDAADATQRKLAHARRQARVFLVEGANPGAEDDDIHKSYWLLQAARRNRARFEERLASKRFDDCGKLMPVHCKIIRMPATRSLAIAALVLTMVIWGNTFVVTKAAAAEVPALTLAFLRFLVAAVVLAPLALLRGGLNRAWLQAMPILFAMSLAGIVLFTIGFNYGLAFASATQASLIYATTPAAIALAAVLVLKERPTRHRIVGIALSIVGVALVIVAGEPARTSPHPWIGALCMLGAVIAWTAYTVLAKRLEHADQLIVIAWITLVAVLVLLPLAAFETAQIGWHMPSARAWLGVLFLGIAASALAYIAYGYALRHLDATLVGVFTNLNPLIGVATAVGLLGERLDSRQLIGGAIALVGMWLASRLDRRSSIEPIASRQ